MANTNCLEGIKCPKCGNEDEFRIWGSCAFLVTDDGSEADGDHEWNDDSTTECTKCGFNEILDAFRAEESEEDSDGN